VVGALEIRAHRTALVTMLKAIEVRGVNDVAKRAHQTSSQVFGMRSRMGSQHETLQPTSSPATCWRHVRKQIWLASTARNCPSYCATSTHATARPLLGLAMKLMALTFVGTSELIGARWLNLT
jgi:hypothetical protein